MRIKKDVKSLFYIPTFGKVQIKFNTNNSEVSFAIADVEPLNEHFKNDFTRLHNTIWTKVEGG